MTAQRLSADQVSSIESELGVEFPVFYRQLLVQEGYGRVGECTDIYHPTEIYELYAPFFDDPSHLFNPYVPFGCDNREQTIWVFNRNRNQAATIWHETLPDDWPEEEWLDYDDWSTKFLSAK